MMVAGKKGPDESKTDSHGIRGTLRDNAEEQLAHSPKRSSGMEGQTPEQLIHELQVHQIELETQAEELRKSHLALEESRDKYLDLYEFAPLGYFTLNDKALITGVNLTGTVLLGVEGEDLVRAPFSKFIAETDADQWHRDFRHLLNTGEKLTCTLMIHRGDGSVFPARLESIRLTGLQDRAITVRVAVSDVHDIRDAEEALRVSEERFRLLLQHVPSVAVQGYSMDGTTQYWNEASEDLYGYTSQEAIGKNLVDLIIPPEMRADVRQACRAMAQSGQPIPASELSLMRKDGSRVEVFSSHAIVKMAGGGTELFCLDIDLTERKRAEEALALASRKLNLLSSITRHDINNQLTVLQGYLAILKIKQSDPTLNEYCSKAANAAKRISAMVQFTKEYEEIGVHAPAWQDCRTLVDTAAKQAPLGKVTVKNDLTAGAEVFADPLIVKVCYNLMDNAIRYGGKITTIRFSALESREDQLIVCEDDGDGIVAAEKEKIFERGFGKNTGLGLALSREILDITGITITETGEPGKGARFEMTVPAKNYRMRLPDDEMHGGGR